MSTRSKTLPFAFALFLAGCADGPTSPSWPPLVPAVPAAASFQAGPLSGAPVRASKQQPSPYACLVGVRRAPHAPNRYGRFFLHFPPGVAGVQTQSGRYDFRLVTEDGRLLAAARCSIPATPAALLLVERFFGKRYGIVRRTDTGGEATLMGCVSDGHCTLEPLVVVGEQPEENDYNDPCDVNPFGPECTGSSGTGGDSGSTDSGGGGTGGEANSDSQDSDQPCLTGDPILDSQAIQAGMDQIWNESNADAPEAERRERGGWITFDGAQYGFVPFGDVSSGPCNLNLQGVRVPENAVGWIHTHPYDLGEVQYECPRAPFGDHYVYTGKTNRHDILAARAIDTVKPGAGHGYFIDKQGISEFSGTTRRGRVESRHDRCGY